jgi:hypothetical protein
MATETIILRPTSHEGTAQGYPNGGTDNVWVNVTEEVADDDASYFEATLTTGLIFTIPEEYLSTTPTSIRVYTRARGSETGTYTVSLAGTQLSSSVVLNTTYQTTYVDVPPESIAKIYGYMATGSVKLGVFSNSSGSSSAKAPTLYLTQTYLEVTYSDEPTETAETIYFKENGAWTSIPCTIYQKQSGAWVVTDSTIFNNGSKFIVQEIT